MPNRIIAHLDMDAFYAAIEERDNPQFAGKPIVVGADPKGGCGRGVVSTANYAARKFGIKSAMPISQAYRLAPKAIFLQPDIEKYQHVSEEILKILKFEVTTVEKASTDEFYLDLSHLRSYEKAVGFMKKMKELVQMEENLTFQAKREKEATPIPRARGGLTASVGIGPNKLVAKIASGKDKPNGLIVIEPSQVLDFLAPLDIQEIPGIGPKTAQKFYAKKIKTIGELRKLSREELRELAGSFGEYLYNLARGKDESPVGEAQPMKSVGKQMTFEKDTADPKLVAETLLALACEVWEEVRTARFSVKTVTVTVRYENFETHTKAETSKEEWKEPAQLKKITLKLLLPFLDRKRKVRLVGIRLSRGSC